MRGSCTLECECTSDQRTFLHLLADYDSPGGADDLLRVVDECGGVRHVIYRFFKHYDVSVGSRQQSFDSRFHRGQDVPGRFRELQMSRMGGVEEVQNCSMSRA